MSPGSGSGTTCWLEPPLPSQPPASRSSWLLPKKTCASGADRTRGRRCHAPALRPGRRGAGRAVQAARIPQRRLPLRPAAPAAPASGPSPPRGTAGTCSPPARPRAHPMSRHCSPAAPSGRSPGSAGRLPTSHMGPSAQPRRIAGSEHPAAALRRGKGEARRGEASCCRFCCCSSSSSPPPASPLHNLLSQAAGHGPAGPGRSLPCSPRRRVPPAPCSHLPRAAPAHAAGVPPRARPAPHVLRARRAPPRLVGEAEPPPAAWAGSSGPRCALSGLSRALTPSAAELRSPPRGRRGLRAGRRPGRGLRQRQGGAGPSARAEMLLGAGPTPGTCTRESRGSRSRVGWEKMSTRKRGACLGDKFPLVSDLLFTPVSFARGYLLPSQTGAVL